MARVKSKNTSPELVVRRALHAAGVRFRLNVSMPGSPDIVLPSRRIAIFVHGCFWHRHPECKRATTPQTNVDYWQRKFSRNVKRDIEVKLAIQQLGWQHLTIWECDTKLPEVLDSIIEHVKSAPKSDARLPKY